MKKVGYIRVSTKDQNPDRQYKAMLEYGIKKKNIYMDKISGKNFARPEYQKMISELKKGDLLVIKSIDRLGRNYGEILEQWKKITKEKEADIAVIDMPLLSTKTAHGDLTEIFIADLVLQILAYVAETERSFIKQRQAEGIAIARAKGVKFGKRRNKLPRKFQEYYEKWRRGEVTVREAAECLNMNYSTFYRRCQEKKEQDEKRQDAGV